jgi:2-haloacid dehalogenase
MAPPRAVLFDAYGTLFDVYSVAQRAEALFPGFGERLSQLWRDKQIEYTRLVTMSSKTGAAPTALYQPFSELTLAALRYATERLGLSLNAQAQNRLMDEYLHLQPHPECQAVLHGLHQRQVRLGILSNGDPPMLNAVVRNAGFEPWFEAVISVHAARRFKTDAAAYALGPQALQLPVADILFVSANAWDALAATWYGYTTLWVNRTGAPPEQLHPAPTHSGTSLHDVLALFPSAPLAPT